MAYQILEYKNHLLHTVEQPATETKIEQPATGIKILPPDTEQNVNQLNRDFCQDNKDILKKKESKARAARENKTAYWPTKIKARNFLSNIAYSRICEKDFSNICFVADALTYITMDMKPFFLTETYFNIEDREMIKMLGEECLPEKYITILSDQKTLHYCINQN